MRLSLSFYAQEIIFPHELNDEYFSEVNIEKEIFLSFREGEYLYIYTVFS